MLCQSSRWLLVFGLALSAASSAVPHGPLWLSPRPGDTVLMGRPLVLRWNTRGLANISVWYSLDTGRTWQRLFADLPADSVVWHVPALDTIALLLRARAEYGASPTPIRERRQAHQAPIRRLRFSPDGTHLLTTAEEGIVKLWNVATLEAADVLVVGTRTTALYAAEFVGDSNRVLIAVDSLLLFYNRPTRERITFGLGGHRKFIRDLAVHPSGRYAATAADDSTVCLWDLTTLQRLACWGEPGVRSWYSVAFSPDGRLLAYGGDNGIIYVRPWQQLWQPPLLLRQHGDSGTNAVIWALCFGTEERLLISGGVDRTVRFWNPHTGQELARGSTHTFHVRSVRSLPWGRRVASGSLDSTLRQWTPTGTQLGRPLFHGGQVLSVDYSPDGRLLASAGRDSAIRIWESGTAQSREDTIKVVLKYPVRLRIAPVVGTPGSLATLAVLHEDYAWLPPLRSDSFSCRLVLRLPAWLVELTGRRVSPTAWDTVTADLWLHAADTLARLPVRLLQGMPPTGPVEPLWVEWRGTRAFDAELHAGLVEVTGHCPGATPSLTIARPLQVRVRWQSERELSVSIVADEDGPYHLHLIDGLGRAVLRQSLALRHGEHSLKLALPSAAQGLYWLQLSTPSRRFVQPLWVGQ